MKYKVISQSKNGKRLQVCFYHNGQSFTRHLHKEGNRWFGVALPWTGGDFTRKFIEPKVVHSIASFTWVNNKPVAHVPMVDYTQWYKNATLVGAAA